MFIDLRETERGTETERECEKLQLVASLTCPDWGRNPQPRRASWSVIESEPFGVQDHAPTDGATQPRLQR